MPMDLTKHDMALTYGGRTFTVRAYQDGSGADGPVWHTIIVENRTPLRHAQGPSSDLPGCFAEAVRFLTAMVDAPAPVRP